MKGGIRKFGAADRRLLPEGRLSGPMPWVIAIMMFLTVLAAAAGLGLGSAASSLDADLANRVTIQIVEPNPDLRQTQAAAVVRALRQQPGIERVRQIDASEMEELLEPWIGAGGLEADLPIPTMIDVDLQPETYERLGALKAKVAAAAPSARVDDNAQWLAPLAKLITSLKWLAAALVLLMIGATAATVVLAARASLDTHRSTIEVLHLMGATDLQVARLFQRRIALDALFGGIVGLVAASLVLLVIGNRVGALGSDLLGSAGLPPLSWLILFTLPVAGVLLAMLVARATILRALGRLL
ncbi:cell division protein FtsX [Sphingosinicella rhizophila]|uniref:FtsX-like permease family protein n=1 Tax=Sphingosinicella rhizophila TaxID=3050082 RepID=A0ABU3Q879_9SPHN|nr:FtsX-like permease family protein [Sphingosinicella sp. GR2756]MDT9599532.1 FtsX-like permease family protein [Sphingosinicella sp. GR2756]